MHRVRGVVHGQAARLIVTFLAIEARPGEMQVDDVPVNEAVSRILEIT
jgi:hypothetical protein